MFVVSLLLTAAYVRVVLRTSDSFVWEIVFLFWLVIVAVSVVTFFWQLSDRPQSWPSNRPIQRGYVA